MPTACPRASNSSAVLGAVIGRVNHTCGWSPVPDRPLQRPYDQFAPEVVRHGTAHDTSTTHGEDHGQREQAPPERRHATRADKAACAAPCAHLLGASPPSVQVSTRGAPSPASRARICIGMRVSVTWRVSLGARPSITGRCSSTSCATIVDWSAEASARRGEGRHSCAGYPLRST
jgi:hypothetical protein